MAKLNFKALQTLNEAFNMTGGYVLFFTDKTFAEFMNDFDIEIDDEKYRVEGSSKAKRLKTFFKLEAATTVARVIRALWEHKVHDDSKRGIIISRRLVQEVKKIISDLESGPASSTEGIENFANSETLEEIIGSIRRDIDAGKHVMALDHLHTYCMKRFAFLLARRGIDCSSTEALHSRAGKYAKAVAAEAGHHEMSLQIVRNGFGIFEKFNDVRNNKSPAHDNVLIAPSEAQFIFEFVCAYLRFVKRLEGQ